MRNQDGGVGRLKVAEHLREIRDGEFLRTAAGLEVARADQPRISGSRARRSSNGAQGRGAETAESISTKLQKHASGRPEVGPASPSLAKGAPGPATDRPPKTTSASPNKAADQSGEGRWRFAEDRWELRGRVVRPADHISRDPTRAMVSGRTFIAYSSLTAQSAIEEFPRGGGFRRAAVRSWAGPP